MIILLVSRQDPASLTLRDAVLRQGDWGPVRDVAGVALRAHAAGRFLLAETPDFHLDADGIDARLAPQIPEAVEAVLVLSKHKSESGKPTLTAHPIGNWGGAAKHGGRPRTVVPPAPRLMSAILARLAAAAPPGYAVSFEATHHGPLLATPTAYVELGSGPVEWEDSVAADAVARAVLAAPADLAGPGAAPVLLGVGGGHYVPRATDLARRGRAAFGHLLPAYALEDVDEATLAAAAAGHDGFLVDPRGDPPGLARVVGMLEKLLPQRREDELR